MTILLCVDGSDPCVSTVYPFKYVRFLLRTKVDTNSGSNVQIVDCWVS